MTSKLQIEKCDILEGLSSKNAPKFLIHFHYKETEIGSHPQYGFQDLGKAAWSYNPHRGYNLRKEAFLVPHQNMWDNLPADILNENTLIKVWKIYEIFYDFSA